MRSFLRRFLDARCHRGKHWFRRPEPIWTVERERSGMMIVRCRNCAANFFVCDGRLTTPKF